MIQGAWLKGYDRSARLLPWASLDEERALSCDGDIKAPVSSFFHGVFVSGDPCIRIDFQNMEIEAIP